MPFRHPSLAATLLLTLPVPGWAHHSHSNYLTSEYTVLKGTVTEFHWMNPHTWIFIEVEDDAGQTILWSLEGASPTELSGTDPVKEMGKGLPERSPAAAPRAPARGPEFCVTG